MVTDASLDRLTAIAREAGRAILASADADLGVSLKKDASPVTNADRAAHDVIMRALADWDRSIPILSEEGDMPPFETRRSWSRFWLVDPLDGTKEFLARSPEYTVNIALVENGAPVLGVVHAPEGELTYVAGRALGAWKQERAAARRQVFSSPASPGDALVVVESRSHPSADLETYLKTIAVKARVQAGSSLKFCWVAEGKADIYPRFGPTMEWDTAAGDCVFRHSGRSGERPSPLRYNTPSLRHDRFVIGLDNFDNDEATA